MARVPWLQRTGSQRRVAIRRARPPVWTGPPCPWHRKCCGSEGVEVEPTLTRRRTRRQAGTARDGDPRPASRRCRFGATARFRGVSAAPQSLGNAGIDPPPEGGASRSAGSGATAPAEPAGVRIVIGRYQRTVVVTVHGELDHPGAAHLGHVLADLIDGQGNLSLLVDLHDATATAADVKWLSVFAEAAERARRRGATITLSKPPALVDHALRDGGLGHIGTLVDGHGAELGPESNGSAPRERRAHPAGRFPSRPSEGSNR